MERIRQRAWITGASVGLLALTCAVLAWLQFRWIGEVSRAEQTRLKEELTSKLSLLRRAFNEEIENSAAALMPSGQQIAELGRDAAYLDQYRRWEQSHERVFKRVALAVPHGDAVELKIYDPQRGAFVDSEWPAEWQAMRDRMERRLTGGPPPSLGDQSLLLEFPRFGGGPGGPGGPGGLRPPFGGPPQRDFRDGKRGEGDRRPPPPPDRGEGPRREPFRNQRPRGLPPRDQPPRNDDRRGGEQEWLIAELNLDHLRGTMLPEMLQRFVGIAGKLDYDAEVVVNSDPNISIFRSLADADHRGDGEADATIRLLEIRPNIGRGFGGRAGRGPGPQFADSGQGRWLLKVRHHSGSLEAVVSRGRWRNIGISIGLLLLMSVTILALMRTSKRAQNLAELQMNFVAGVSHELRTPLTVMSTAAYNLRGKIAGNPSQVERYGALIQEQCERLTAIVEQVLLFAKSKSGGELREREPVSLDALIEEELRANRSLIEKSGCRVETSIQPDLPVVMGDATALRHALQNLITNAVKYGTEGSDWIGVAAAAVEGRGGQMVEIRVTDRGPGIPREEQSHIFDPFYRGRRAVEDQIHGTGLGLNLVKRIVEAHGGTVALRSEPMKQTEFTIQIPAAPQEIQDEVAHSFD